jgi:hypothetical protein
MLSWRNLKVKVTQVKLKKYFRPFSLGFRVLILKAYRHGSARSTLESALHVKWVGVRFADLASSGLCRCSIASFDDLI